MILLHAWKKAFTFLLQSFTKCCHQPKIKYRFARPPNYCFVLDQKIELLTIFRKYNKTIPKMKWCFF